MPWLLLRRVAVAVRNCYQFGGDTVKGKIGRGACGLLRGLGGCEGQVELNEKTKPERRFLFFFYPYADDTARRRLLLMLLLLLLLRW